jgi:regulator of ribonuclease activity A
LRPASSRIGRTWTLPTEKRNVGQRDGPMQLQGVWGRPGDWLLADADGIVVMATRRAEA